MSVYAPGRDFAPALAAVAALRSCDLGPLLGLNNTSGNSHSNLVRELVTFHFVFDSGHVPEGGIPDAVKASALEAGAADCGGLDKMFPSANGGKSSYRSRLKLEYPVNVARNAAREAARTHFVLASDIELYPSPGAARGFLDMVAAGGSLPDRGSAFPLPIFELAGSVGLSALPRTKPELAKLLEAGAARLFHANFCRWCHTVPGQERWLKEDLEEGKKKQEQDLFNELRDKGQEQRQRNAVGTG